MADITSQLKRKQRTSGTDPKREQDRSNQEQDRSKREQDRSDRKQDRPRAAENARERTQKLHVDPFSLELTPMKLFAKRYNLPLRCGSDGALRVFPDDPREMPPISCLLGGCEKVWFTNLTYFFGEH